KTRGSGRSRQSEPWKGFPLRESDMATFRLVMTTVALAGFIAATVPAAAQDVRHPGKAAAHATHAKKRTARTQQTSPAPARGMSGSGGFDRGGGNSSGGGGGGYCLFFMAPLLMLPP